MNLNEMIYLLVIGKLGGKCSLNNVWKELAELQGTMPEFKLVQRNFYSVIQKLEAEKLITSKVDRPNVHFFPTKLISITPIGLKYVEAYSEVLYMLIPISPEEQSSPSIARGRRRIDLEQDDLADLTQSVVFEISNNLFDFDSIDDDLHVKIDVSTRKIIKLVQKYM